MAQGWWFQRRQRNHLGVLPVGSKGGSWRSELVLKVCGSLEAELGESGGDSVGATVGDSPGATVESLAGDSGDLWI